MTYEEMKDQDPNVKIKKLKRNSEDLIFEVFSDLYVGV